MTTTTQYLPLSENREIQITITHREYNGIDTDPAIIEREPTLAEIHHMHAAGFRDFSIESIFDHIDGGASAQSTRSPGLAGGFKPSAPPIAGAEPVVVISGDKRPFSEWSGFACDSTPAPAGDYFRF